MANKMKVKLNKKKIIDTAFKVWGKILFSKTSLSTLTNKLNITKPALYRHFKNKNELITSMKIFVENKLSDITILFINETKNLNPELILKRYIEVYFNYFAKNIYIFYFYLLYVIKEPYINQTNNIKLTEKINEIFLNKILKINDKNKSLKMGICERYVFSIIIFHILYENKNKKKIKPINEQKIQSLISKIYNIAANGFGNKNNLIKINYDLIEKNIKIDNKYFNRDKVFNSIASVVANEGMWNTTISKISKELNMSKSSLYFYFKNKKEMLTNTVIEEIKRKHNIIIENIENNSEYEEKLYCIIFTITNYLFKDTRILKVFDWLHFQKINFKKINNAIEKYSVLLKVIDEGLKKEKLINHNENSDFISSFLNMQIVKELYCYEILNCSFNIKEIKYIYNYFLKGIFINLEEI